MASWKLSRTDPPPHELPEGEVTSLSRELFFYVQLMIIIIYFRWLQGIRF